ncbi:MAG TPA: SEC-C metal-binding domain-containing protein [Solirubrobacteraceae bacterium]|nr:SEC-C metal-binding domain-containing protein [Solirubrobacteraceae bacterium]
MTVDLAELRPEGIEAADARALELLADGQPDEAVSLLKSIVHRAVTKHGDEDLLTGMAQSRLADMLRRTGAPEAEQLGALTDAIKAFSASVGPSDPQTTSAFGRLAHVALAAEAVEIAVTAGMQAIGGLQARGEGETPEAGGIYAALAMAAAARRSPGAPGAAERAYRLTAAAGGDDADRRRGLAAWRALGQPRRIAVTEELSLVTFGSPPGVVVELDHVAEDGALDQHTHGLRTEAARVLREQMATAPFAYRASSGGFEVVSRSGAAAAAVRFDPDVEVLLDADAFAALRSGLAEALLGPGGGKDEPGRNDPCSCGSGRKYKRCCGV